MWNMGVNIDFRDEILDGQRNGYTSGFEKRIEKDFEKVSNTFWWRFKSEEKLLFAGGTRIFGISTHQGRVETQAKEVSCNRKNQTTKQLEATQAVYWYDQLLS